MEDRLRLQPQNVARAVNSGSWFDRFVARHHGHLWTKIVPKSLLLLLIMVFDPFHIASGSGRMSEDIANRVLSFTYPAPLLNGAGRALSGAPVSDSILVVTLDDRDANWANPLGGYPVPLASHGEVLKTALCFAPAAVFVDINFRWERAPGDAAAFADSLSHRATPSGCLPQLPGSAELANTPVFVAFVPSETSGCQPTAPVVPVVPIEPGAQAPEDCSERAVFAPLRSVVRPVAMPGTDDTRRYVLHDPRLDAYTPGSTSPALELYRHVCTGNPDFAPGCKDLATAGKLDHRTSGRPALAVRWGFRRSATADGDDREAINAPLVNGGCPTLQTDASSPISDSLIQLGAEATTRRPYGQTQRLGGAGWCPYHTTIGYRQLLHAAKTDPERLKRLIEGRIIFYGQDITAVNDIVVSPVLGALPGVHVHAMATDNLLSMGASYWRDPPEIPGGIGWNEILGFILSVLAISIGEYASHRQSLIPTAMRRMGFAFGYLALMLLGILGLTAVLIFFFGWAPINCIGLLAISTLSQPKFIFATPVRKRL